MASGDIVGIIHAITPPGTTYATPDVRVGGSTPAEAMPVWDFDSAAEEHLDFHGVIDGYAGGGFTVTVIWSATTATTGGVVWGGAFRAVPDDAEDIDAAHTYVFNNSATSTAPSASGEVSEDAITFTDGADADSVADGDSFVFRIKRVVGDAGDDMAGDAELWSVIIRET
jgi:hypothetical protein